MRAAGLDCRSPKGCVKLAFQQGWIEDEQRWLAILDDRNLTSHTYDEATAAEIYGRLPDHLAAFRALVDTLQAL